MTYKDNAVKDLRIAYIGGGSRGWAWTFMRDLALEPALGGTIVLYDIDKEAAKANEIIGNGISEREEAVGKWKYIVADTLKEALTGSDFVVISILPGTFDEMESDVHEPEKYGIYQSVGDTAGPGGMVRALRTIPMFVTIAEAIRDYAPQAWVINYTNPMSLCVKTLYHVFPQIKAFGCCHEVFGTQKLLAQIAERELGIADIKRDEIIVNVLGLNHFTWFDSASYKGIDLFPVYRSFIEKHFEEGFEEKDKNWMNSTFSCAHRVKFDLFKKYGWIAAAGDRHLAEFMPPIYLKDPETVASWKFGLTTVAWRKEDLKKRLEKSKMDALAQNSEEYRKNKQIIRSKNIEALVNCTTDVNASIERLAEMGIDISAASYRVAIFDIDLYSGMYQLDTEKRQESALMAFVLFNISDEIVTREEAGIAYQEGNNRVGILFQEKWSRNFTSRTKEICHEIQEKTKEVMGFDVSMGIGKWVKKPEELIQTILDKKAPTYHHSGAAAQEDSAEGESVGRQIYKHLMNGVSHMLPFVIGGGILIALAFLVDNQAINPANFGKNTPLAALLKTIGEQAFGFMLPILAGFIAMSIADRPGLAIGFVGGALANGGYTFANIMAYDSAKAVSSGFIGALFAGFVGGYIMVLLRKLFDKLPSALEGLKPILLFPVCGILIMGVVMIAVNPVVGAINTGLNNFLSSMSGTSSILLGAVLGAMMSIDMGGPFNKAAYVFGTAQLTVANAGPEQYAIMAAVMAGGMVPPLAIALCTTFFKNRFTESERKSGVVNYIMGLSFITEGAIPFAAGDPIHILPPCIVGSAVAGALSMAFKCGLPAPHGGIFVIGVITNPVQYLISVVVGAVIGMIVMSFTKKPLNK